MFIVAIIAKVFDVVLTLVVWVIIAQVIASWLVAFGVVNMRNRGVYAIIDGLNRITEPLLQPIRRIVPSLGGLDLSPLILLLLISYVIRPILYHYFPVAYL